MEINKGCISSFIQQEMTKLKQLCYRIFLKEFLSNQPMMYSIDQKYTTHKNLIC